MNEHLKRSIPLAAIVVFVILACLKTRYEVMRRTEDQWKGDSSTRWVEKATEWNPWLPLPNPSDIASGREPVRPMREVTSPPVRSDLTLKWQSDPFDCEMNNGRTVRENGEQFAARAGSDATAMLRAFPAR